mgnify:CR=1 FL=1
MGNSVQTMVMTVQVELQDPTGIRWSATEIIGHLSAAATEIVIARPDSNAVHSTFAPAVGALQELPASAVAFIDIAGNAGGKKQNITRVDKAVLDAIQPKWQSAQPVAEIQHFCIDPNIPRTFYLYPPASSAARIDLITADAPTAIPQPAGDGKAWTTASGSFPLRSEFTEAAIQFALFKCWSKDAEFGGNASLAASHFSLFQQALGIQRVAATSVASTK